MFLLIYNYSYVKRLNEAEGQRGRVQQPDVTEDIGDGTWACTSGVIYHTRSVKQVYWQCTISITYNKLDCTLS